MAQLLQEERHSIYPPATRYRRGQSLL